jgi:hypothetical protein
MLHADQDIPPGHLDHRAVSTRRRGDGTGQIVVTLSDLEIEEFVAGRQFSPIPFPV